MLKLLRESDNSEACWAGENALARYADTFSGVLSAAKVSANVRAPSSASNSASRGSPRRIRRDGVELMPALTLDIGLWTLDMLNPLPQTVLTGVSSEGENPARHLSIDLATRCRKLFRLLLHSRFERRLLINLFLRGVFAHVLR